MPEQILRATQWHTNGAMMADVAKLGYLEGSVLDATYGHGIFWRTFQPEVLVSNDLTPTKGDLHHNFRSFPFSDQMFNCVVFDPPYKVAGTTGMPGSGTDYTVYGITYKPNRDVRSLIEDGVRECARVAKTHLLVKCMDQVASTDMWWQTDQITEIARDCGFRKVDRFDLLRSAPRPLARGVTQRHAAANYSTLLVFRRQR